MTIISFPPKTTDRDLIWVCNCGCASFELRGDGSAVCRACESDVSEPGAWWDSVKNGPTTDATPEYQDGGNGPEFAERLAKRHAQDADILIAIRQNGRVQTWARDLTTREQFEWLQRRVEDAMRLLESDLE